MKSKNKYLQREISEDWFKTCCCICGLKLSTSTKDSHEKTQNLTISALTIRKKVRQQVFAVDICQCKGILTAKI